MEPETSLNLQDTQEKMIHLTSKRSGYLIVGIILLMTAYLFSQLAYAAVIAISLAVVLMPVQHYLAKRIGTGYAAATVCLISLATLATFILVFINSIIVTRVYIFNVAQTIADAVRNYQPGGGTMLGSIISTLGTTMNQAGSAAWIENSVPIILQSLGSIAQSLPGLTIQTLIVVLMLFLLLKNGEETASRLKTAIPSHMKAHISTLCNVVTDTMYGVYVVNVGIAILTFFITIPFFWVLGYGEILFWAFICGASHLFPFFGPQLITVFLGVYAIAQGDMRGLILIGCIGYPLISGVQDFWIRPRMLARRVAIHPVLMMIGIFGGMLILGPIGLIIGPLIVALADAAFDILITIQHNSDTVILEE